MIGHEAGNDFPSEEVKHGGVAEETSDVDQHLPGEQLDFGLFATQPREVGFRGLEPRRGHSALDISIQRAALVVREIVYRLLAQQSDDIGQAIVN